MWMFSANWKCMGVIYLYVTGVFFLSQSWSCPNWRRYSWRPTSCLQRQKWWRTPQWGARRGRFPTCAASIWMRPSAPLPRQQMRKWSRGSNTWPAPRKRDTRVQNTCPEASLCTASPNCCSSSALCKQLIRARTCTRHSCEDGCTVVHQDVNVHLTHADMTFFNFLRNMSLLFFWV